MSLFSLILDICWRFLCFHDDVLQRISQWGENTDCYEVNARWLLKLHDQVSHCPRRQHLLLLHTQNIHTSPHICTLEVLSDLILPCFSHCLFDTFLEVVLSFRFSHSFGVHVRVITRSLPVLTFWLQLKAKSLHFKWTILWILLLRTKQILPSSSFQFPYIHKMDF